MGEKIKLGLTRNRLFEFDNCVCFVGAFKECLDVGECEKALKMLFLKEPILSCKAELSGDGDAFLITESVAPFLETITHSDLEAFVEQRKRHGLDFNEKLFSFSLVNGNVLVVFAHTLVADVRSLCYLAGEFKSFLQKENLNILPSEICVLSESSELPSNVFSVVIDRVASGLEVGWQKKIKAFSFEDYTTARERYFNKKSPVKSISCTVDEALLEKIKSFAEKNCVDVSSVVAYSFYENLMKNTSGKRKYRKLNVFADERVFLQNGQKLKVGAFNGVVSVVLKKKKKETLETQQDKVCAFHKGIYKKITTAFSVFYNEVLLMRLSGSFCDSQYMCLSGAFNHKYSKKLAYTYGCANEVMGEFCSLNLSQKYWQKLQGFENVCFTEPLKCRSSSMITFIQKSCTGEIVFEYKTEKISENTAENIKSQSLEENIAKQETSDREVITENKLSEPEDAKKEAAVNMVMNMLGNSKSKGSAADELQEMMRSLSQKNK